MTDIIIHKHSITAGDPPTAAELDLGELAIQAADGHIYLKRTDGAVVRVTMLPGGGEQQVLYKTGSGDYALGWGTITKTLMGATLWSEVVAEVQSVFALVEGTASVLLAASATLPANSTGPLTVSVADANYLTDGTSITGVLGTVYGTLSRSGSTYSFVSNQSYTSDVVFATGTRFAAAFLNNNFNPLRVGDAELNEDAGYLDAGYAYVMVDAANRVAWGVKADGSIEINKAVSLTGAFTGTVTGNLTGDVTGNLTGDVTGNLDADTANTNTLSIYSGGSQSGDLSYSWFYAQAVTDADGRIAYGVRHDGAFEINQNLSFKSENAYDYYLFAQVDENGRISYAIKQTGELYIPSADITQLNCQAAEIDSLASQSASIDSLSVQSITIADQGTIGLSRSAVSTLTGLFESKIQNGQYQIFKSDSAGEVRLTSTGDNYNIALTSETPERLLFQSTRTGENATHIMKQDGSDLALAIPPKNLALWGDSMTAGLGSTRVANALGDGRRVVANGYGGRRSVFIAARQGGFPITGNIANSEIPASGAVAVSSYYPAEVLDTDYQSLSCAVNGLAGTLNYNGGSWTFTRSAAGDAVAVTNPVTFEPILDDTVNNVVYNLNEYTAILWLGRNGVGGTQGETDVTVYQGVIAKFRNLFKRLIILSIFNGGYSSESDGDPAIPTTSTSGYDDIMGRNGNIAAAFPDLWYDVRRDFVDGSEAWLQANYPAAYALDWTRSFYQIGSGAVSGRPATANNGDIWDDSGTKTIYDTATSSWVAYTGNPRTQANLGPDSAWDVTNDVPPRAMRGDTIHLNNYGNEFLAELLAAKIQLLGW